VSFCFWLCLLWRHVDILDSLNAVMLIQDKAAVVTLRNVSAADPEVLRPQSAAFVSTEKRILATTPNW
jgi:hypothetical protein